MKLPILQTAVFLGLYYPLATNAALAELPRRLTVEDEETLHASLRTTRDLKKAAAPTAALSPAAAPKPKKGKIPGGGTTSSTSSSPRAIYNPGPCIPFANVPISIFDATRAKSTSITAKDTKNGITPATYNVCLVENGCSTGGCRYYNWLVCDTVGEYPWLKFVCNNGAAAPLPVIPINTSSTTTNSTTTKSDTNIKGGVISGLNAAGAACVNVDTTAQQAKWKSNGFHVAPCQRSSECQTPGDCCAEDFCACLPLKNTGRCVY